MRTPALFATGMASTVASLFATHYSPGTTAALLCVTFLLTLSSIGKDRPKQ